MRKHKTILFIGVFSFFLCLSCTRVEKNYYANGRLEAEISYKYGKLNGKSFWYYQHGVKSLEINYKSGLKEGEMIRYFRNGKIESIDNYTNDTLNGSSLKYHENGILASEYSYKNGKKDGIIKHYFSDGSLFFTGQYLDDQYDGHWEYFDEEEFKTGEGNFTKGTGILTVYDSKGNTIKRVHYINSVVCKEENFSKENYCLEKTLFYENGRILNIENNH